MKLLFCMVILSVYFSALFCVPDNCQSGSTCNEENRRCDCPPGFTGLLCDTGQYKSKYYKVCLIDNPAEKQRVFIIVLFYTYISIICT